MGTKVSWNRSACQIWNVTCTECKRWQAQPLIACKCPSKADRCVVSCPMLDQRVPVSLKPRKSPTKHFLAARTTQERDEHVSSLSVPTSRDALDALS